MIIYISLKGKLLMLDVSFCLLLHLQPVMKLLRNHFANMKKFVIYVVFIIMYFICQTSKSNTKSCS
jgi:hypothetical protein